MKTTTTVKQHVRETKNGWALVHSHERNIYKPTGRFGAYNLNGYETEYAVYCNYDEDPLYDGGSLGGIATEDFDEAIEWAEAYNKGTNMTGAMSDFCTADVADWTEAERNWKPTAAMKMSYLK